MQSTAHLRKGEAGKTGVRRETRRGMQANALELSPNAEVRLDAKRNDELSDNRLSKPAGRLDHFSQWNRRRRNSNHRRLFPLRNLLCSPATSRGNGTAPRKLANSTSRERLLLVQRMNSIDLLNGASIDRRGEYFLKVSPITANGQGVKDFRSQFSFSL